MPTPGVLGGGSLCLSQEAHPDCPTPASWVSPTSVPASGSGPCAPGKSLPTVCSFRKLNSWLWGRETAPSRGQGLGGFPGPVVGGLGNPVPLQAWGFCHSGYLHFWELVLLWTERNEKQNPRAQHHPLPVLLPLSHSQSPAPQPPLGATARGGIQGHVRTQHLG